MKTRGVSNLIELHTILTDVVDEIEAGENPDIDCFHGVTVLIEELVELMQNDTNADSHVQGSSASFYKSCLQSVVHNANYWLSDIEPLCLCACR